MLENVDTFDRLLHVLKGFLKTSLLCPVSESPSGKRQGFQDNATGNKMEV